MSTRPIQVEVTNVFRSKPIRKLRYRIGILGKRLWKHWCFDEACCPFGRVDDFQPKGHGFDSRSSRHVGILGKSFTYSCLCDSAWNSGKVSVLCRERFWVVEDLERRYRNSLNELMSTAMLQWVFISDFSFEASTHGSLIAVITSLELRRRYCLSSTLHQPSILKSSLM